MYSAGLQPDIRSAKGLRKAPSAVPLGTAAPISHGHWHYSVAEKGVWLWFRQVQRSFYRLGRTLRPCREAHEEWRDL